MAGLIANPGYRWFDAAPILMLASVYCGLAAWVLHSSMTLNHGNITILWLPGGLALASLLIGGIKLWPGVFLGAMAAGLVVDDPLWVSALIATGNVLETVCAALALKACRQFDTLFRKPNDFILLISIAGLSACISAMIGPGTLALAGYLKTPELLDNMLRWWQADALGMILLTPLLLIWRKLPTDWFAAQHWPETLICLSLAFIVNQMVFGDWHQSTISGLEQHLWPVPFLIWIAVRRGTHGVTLFVAMTTIQAFEGARHGVGYYASDLQASGLLNLWAFVLVISIVGISLALTIKAQQQLKRHLESIINSTSECIKLVSRQGKILAMNPAGLTSLAAKSSDQVLFQDIKTLIAPEYWDDYQILHRNACDGSPGQLEFEVTSLDGRRIWMESRVVPFYDDSTGETVELAFTRDITDRKIAERKLMLAADVFKHVRESIVITDADKNIIEVNATFCQITGYSADEVMGRNPRFLQSGRHPSAFYADMWNQINDEDFWRGEIWNHTKQGDEFAVLLTISAVKDQRGKVISYIGLFNDITLLKTKQKRLENLAHYDQLTGLANRLLLMDRLHHAMAQCKRNRNRLAVLFIDLDGFKLINDEYGHDVGDQLLICIAHRLKDVLREVDTLARIGGDEFIGIMVGVDDTSAVEPVLQRFLLAAAQPVQLDAQRVQISISIGISFFPDDSEHGDELIRHADQAMYHAKKTGKNRYHFFSSTPSAD